MAMSEAATAPPVTGTRARAMAHGDLLGVQRNGGAHRRRLPFTLRGLLGSSCKCCQALCILVRADERDTHMLEDDYGRKKRSSTSQQTGAVSKGQSMRSEERRPDVGTQLNARLFTIRIFFLCVCKSYFELSYIAKPPADSQAVRHCCYLQCAYDYCL